MFLNVCKQTFHISHVRISQKVKGVLMWDPQHIISIWRRRYWQIFKSALVYLYVKGLNIVLKQRFHDVITFAALQIFFSVLLLKWGIKPTRFWNSSLNLMFSIFSFFLSFFFKLKKIFSSFQLFANGHIQNVVSTLINVVKLDVESNNIVSTLSNVVNVSV